MKKKKVDIIGEVDKNDSLVQVITKKNGVEYTVRHDRHRYFFPDEWDKFIESMTNDTHKLLFQVLLNSGARIMEVLHLKPKNFDFDRGTVTFEVVKQRTAKKGYAKGKNRSFFISKQMLRRISGFISKNGIKEDDYLFMDRSELPKNYESLANKDKKKFYIKKEVSYSKLMKRRLKSIGIKDWKNFSLHNIRKTYGNWMRTYDLRTEELCYRMGHDLQTYMNHYGSSIVFTPNERVQIRRIIGDVQ